MADLTYALTLIQPWAYAVTHAGKRVENRTWPPSPKMLRPGDLLAIHAGFKVDRAACAELRRAGVQLPSRLSTGAVVAVARYGGVLTYPQDLAALDPSQRRWFVGPLGWRLEDVVALREPVPCKGRLGLWKMGEAVRDEVMRQIEVAHG